MPKFLALIVLSFLLILTIKYTPTVEASNVKVPILMYHYIGNNPNPKDTMRDSLSVTPAKFEQQLTYLSQNGYTPISLDTLYGIFNNQTAAPPKPIVLTFDDGYIDFYTTAYPILKKYNMKAVSFIPTSLMNQGYYMSWAQVKEIASSGLVTFESIALTHTNLASLSGARLLSELKDSKNILQSQTGYPVNFIAYPYGISTVNIQNLTRQVGYVGGLGTWYGKASGPGINLPRIRITGQMDLKDFASRL